MDLAVYAESSSSSSSSSAVTQVYNGSVGMGPSAGSGVRGANSGVPVTSTSAPGGKIIQSNDDQSTRNFYLFIFFSPPVFLPFL